MSCWQLSEESRNELSTTSTTSRLLTIYMTSRSTTGGMKLDLVNGSSSMRTAMAVSGMKMILRGSPMDTQHHNIRQCGA